MPKRIVNLDALLNADLSVTLDGEEVPVKPIDGGAYQLLSSMEGEASVGVMYKVASRCLPTLAEERVLSLTPAQVGAVVKLASEGVDQVEAVASPNSAPAGIRTGKHKLQRA